MKLRAGSSLWLLRHELRLFVIKTFATRGDAKKPGALKKVIAIWLGMAAFAHALAYFLLDGLDASAGVTSHQQVMVVSAIMGGALSMMISSGLKESVEALYVRGDLDLLLSSPLPSRSIFTVRLAAVAIGIGALYLFFLAPFAHAGMLLGQYQWLGVYPAVISMALASASLSMLLTLGLVRWLGARRTRTVAQVLGALSGALFFLASQAHSTRLGRALGQSLIANLPGPDHALWLPGRAALGAPLEGLCMLGAGVIAFFVTVRLTNRAYVQSAQQAVSDVGVAARPAGALRFHFGRGLAQVIILKEWRLIARDPHLISQVLLQLLYLIPMGVLLFSGDTTALRSIGAALTFLCGSLTASLAWIIIAAEDAPDLLNAAPCRAATIRRAKLAAATIPTLALLAMPLAWAATRDLAAAGLLAILVVAATVSAAQIVQWCGRPFLRGEFKARGKGNALATVLEFLCAAGWATAAFLLISSVDQAGSRLWLVLGAAGATAFSMLILAIARSRRARMGTG